MLDLLSGGRFELGIGRGIPGEVELTVGRVFSSEELMRRWTEGLELLRVALTESEFTFDGQFMQVVRPTTIATRPLQDPLPVWLGGASLDTMAIAGRNGWNIMRNFGEPKQHRAAFEHYRQVADEHGHERTGANFMIERFVAIGETREQAEENLARLCRAFGRFIALYADGGRRPLPTTDGELLLDHAAPGGDDRQSPSSARRRRSPRASSAPWTRPALPGFMVETFSREEMRLFAGEVLPALRAGVLEWRSSASDRSPAWRSPGGSGTRLGTKLRGKVRHATTRATPAMSRPPVALAPRATRLHRASLAAASKLS